MSVSLKIIFFSLFIHTAIAAETVQTFYGPLEVEEPVLLELIHSPAFQRLKKIHQYGVCFYTNFKEPYNRYEHSLGVFAILRIKGASLNEQIAGLLHDVSHTVFSHVGDWIFDKANCEKDYQNSIHIEFLKKYGVAEILSKYGIEAETIDPVKELYPMLEQDRPSLCADRIDYNIQGAFYQEFITYEEAIEILQDLQFKDGNWVSKRPDLMEKLCRLSLYMTERCWGGPTNHLMSAYLAEAILRALDTHLITLDDIHFGTDDVIWQKLLMADDLLIRSSMKDLHHVESLFCFVPFEEADLVIKSKFRGIDPWIEVDGSLKRLTGIKRDLLEEFLKVKELVETGWGIKFASSEESEELTEAGSGM